MIKKLSLSVLFILAVGVFYLFTQSQNLMEIESEIEIAAPLDKVWQVVTDIEKWSDFNSVINASTGIVSLGSAHTVTMRGENPGEVGPQYASKIISFDEGKSYRWRAVMGAGIIFTNDKVFELQATDDGTLLKHTEVFNGMMLPLMKGFMQEGVPPILDEMNQAFKAEAEK
ncbi:MAG: SRPBCC domain-containing protein [Lentilitoribacter sp.]